MMTVGILTAKFFIQNLSAKLQYDIDGIDTIIMLNHDYYKNLICAEQVNSVNFEDILFCSLAVSQYLLS